MTECAEGRRKVEFEVIVVEDVEMIDSAATERGVFEDNMLVCVGLE